MPQAERRALLALLAVPVLLTGACSGHSAEPSPAPSSSSRPSTTSIGPVSGKTLTVAQLADAGLTSSELPAGLALVKVRWEPAGPRTIQIVADAVCQPVVDLLREASSSVSNSYQGVGIIYPGGMSLASYPPAEAASSFAAVKNAIQKCPSISWTSYGSTKHGKLTPLGAPHLGDDSVGFALSFQGAGPLVETHDYFRVGASTFHASLMASDTVPPEISREILTAQINKLKAAQDG
jgi:hypothetical protein